MRTKTACATALVVAGLTLSGCGGSDDDNKGSSSPPYCADRNAVKQSILALKEVDVKKDGVAVLRMHLLDVRTTATEFIDSAKSEFSQEALDLRTTVTELGNAVRQVVGDPSGPAVENVRTMVTKVQTSYQQLSDAVSSKC